MLSNSEAELKKKTTLRLIKKRAYQTFLLFFQYSHKIIEIN